MRPIALVHVFISVSSGQSQASYHPRRTLLSPCLPLIPGDSNKPTCTAHTGTHTFTYTAPEKLAPTHTHSYILPHIHTHVLTCATHSHIVRHKGRNRCTHTCLLIHTHVDSPQHPLTHTFPHTCTHTCNSSTFIHLHNPLHMLAHLHSCSHLQTHSGTYMWTPRLLSQGVSEMSGIFQPKIVEHASCSGSGQLRIQ